MDATEYADRRAVALGEENHLVGSGEVRAIQLPRPLLRVRVQPLEQWVRAVLAEQREAEGHDRVEVGNAGGADE